jgi:hypothetical protein
MDEYTADAWHDLLGEYGLGECRHAVVLVARRQPFVSASEIITEVRRERRAEMGRIRAAQLEADRPQVALCPARSDSDMRMLRADIEAIFEGTPKTGTPDRPACASTPDENALEDERRRQLAALEEFMAQESD